MSFRIRQVGVPTENPRRFEVRNEAGDVVGQIEVDGMSVSPRIGRMYIDGKLRWEGDLGKAEVSVEVVAEQIWKNFRLS